MFKLHSSHNCTLKEVADCWRQHKQMKHSRRIMQEQEQQANNPLTREDIEAEREKWALLKVWGLVLSYSFFLTLLSM